MFSPSINSKEAHAVFPDASRVGGWVNLGNPGVTLDLIRVVDDDGTPSQL